MKLARETPRATRLSAQPPSIYPPLPCLTRVAVLCALSGPRGSPCLVARRRRTRNLVRGGALERGIALGHLRRAAVGESGSARARDRHRLVRLLSRLAAVCLRRARAGGVLFACTLVHAVCPSFSETILSQPRMHSKLTTLNGGEAMADWTIKRATPSEDIHTSEMAIVQSITLEKQASA